MESIDIAVIGDNGYSKTERVCGQDKDHENRISDFGLCDMAGNVWELTSDAYDPKFYDRMPARDPHNPVTDPSKQWPELRGGSCIRLKHDARATKRYYDRPTVRSYNVGFRCAWSANFKGPLKKAK